MTYDVCEGCNDPLSSPYDRGFFCVHFITIFKKQNELQTKFDQK